MDLIISLAINGRDKYEEIQKGLIATLDIAGNCDKWIFQSYPDGVTPHSEIPYKFKYDLILQGYAAGYKRIWWLDSTMRIIKNPFDLFSLSDKGIVAFDNLGHPLYKYITDLAVTNLDCEALLMSIQNSWGGAIGFDFTKPEPILILNEILKQSKLGSFDNGTSTREGFVAARHDQSCNSVLFYYYGVKLFDYGVIAARKDVTDKTYIQYGS